MKKGLNRGFTIVELLVAIAIIGVISSIVLVSLGKARNKGNDAAVETNLGSIRVEAVFYRESHSNSYTNLNVPAAAPVANKMYNAAVAAGDGSHNSFNTGAGGLTWHATVGLKTTNEVWCVDSTRFSGKISEARANQMSIIGANALCQ